MVRSYLKFTGDHGYTVGLHLYYDDSLPRVYAEPAWQGSDDVAGIETLYFRAFNPAGRLIKGEYNVQKGDWLYWYIGFSFDTTTESLTPGRPFDVGTNSENPYFSGLNGSVPGYPYGFSLVKIEYPDGILRHIDHFSRPPTVTRLVPDSGSTALLVFIALVGLLGLKNGVGRLRKF